MKFEFANVGGAYGWEQNEKGSRDNAGGMLALRQQVTCSGIIFVKHYYQQYFKPQCLDIKKDHLN